MYTRMYTHIYIYYLCFFYTPIWPCAIYEVLRKMNKGNRYSIDGVPIYIYIYILPGRQGPRGGCKGPAHKGSGGHTRAKGGPQGPRGAHKVPAHKGPVGPQGPTKAHKGPADKGPAHEGPGRQQGPRGSHKGLAFKGPVFVHICVWQQPINS